MRVERDFEELYRTEDDPWGIGEAKAERYDVYREMLLRHSGSRGRLLDVGCGLGAPLARCEGDFDQLVGLELSSEAIDRGARRFPGIRFVQGSADELGRSPVDGDTFDAIVYSDVIAYLDEAGKRGSLRWIADHLAKDGVALVAAWCPGGDYPTPEELERLVSRELVILDKRLLETGHQAFVARRKRWLVALTVDYETWQPIPEGRRIDWEADVFAPTDRLMEACGRQGVPLTLFAELGEYLWLAEHEPDLADRMAAQWRAAVSGGHDVQLHLHPSWLPELGARRDGDRWEWDWRYGRAADYPGDLAELVGRCKTALEEAIRPARSDYEVTCFRAGAYEAQPFTRLYDALEANGIGCDSSVYAGGHREGRSYDYSLAYSDHQPYFASRYDPQLKAPPSERAVVELPIFTPKPGQRWTFDGGEGAEFAGRLRERRELLSDAGPSSEGARRLAQARWLVSTAYWLARGHRRVANRVLPRPVARLMTTYGPERLVGDEYFVLVGHTKANLDIEAIEQGLRDLEADFEFPKLSELAARSRPELERAVNTDAGAEARRQVRREYRAVMGDERNESQSFRLQELIPWDRRRVLDLGCGAGTWSARIAELRPWMDVVGVDVGEDFIAKARRQYESARVSFQVEDFAALSFAEGSFDCVYADNSLEHAFDVDATLREITRVLRPGGVLVAALPPDARNPAQVCDNHTWKTAPHEVRMRLEAAGLVDVEVEEIDTYRELGMPPFPPSDDRMMYLTAWRRDSAATGFERAAEVADFVYRALNPGEPHDTDDLRTLLARGRAWCAGYTLAAGLLLRREGYGVRWATMVAHQHPRGRGTAREDTHEVLEVRSPSGDVKVLDAMANRWFDASLDDLLRDPGLAATDGEGDARWRERGYDLYASSFWYERVVRIAMRDDLGEDQRFRTVAPEPAAA